MADFGDSDSGDNDPNEYKSPKSNNNESDEESSSSSSDGESDKCPICLTRLGQQDLASPNSCLHTYCLNCLTEWAKNAKTCPIDRLDFKFIIVRSVDGKLLREIDISVKNEEDKPLAHVDDLTYCEVCHLSNREDELLLCDICDNGYHMDCLNPPLYVVPLEEWYCPQCQAREEQSDNDIDRNEIDDILNDLNEDERLLRPRQSRIRQQQQRLVPRTRASERVRMNTRRLQQNTTAVEGGSAQSTSCGRKTRKYSKRKVRVKKRCKKGKKLVRKKNTQLSDKLGVCSSRWSKHSSGDNRSLDTSLSFMNNTTLSIFGSRNDLDYVPIESDDEHDIGGNGPLHMSTMSRLRISTADLISRKEISEILRRPVRRNINISHNIDSINILDTILNVQDKQFKKKPIENEMKNVDKHTTQTPMYSDHRTDRNSGSVNNYSSNRNNNRNYPRNNDQSYSDTGNSSSFEESQLTNDQNFSENQPVNPFPFRNTGPIKFRMNVTKMGERKQPQTPPKVVTTEINVEEESGPSMQTEETYKALEPPPEPPAFLMGINLDEDEDDQLVIDDKDYYDPENPSDNDEVTEVTSRPTGTAYMQSPTYGGYMEQVEHRSIPHIPISSTNNVLCPDDDGTSSEEDDKEINDDCPNISLYSTASLKISSSPKEYGPFLEHEEPKSEKLNEEAELQYIPMPPVSPERDLDELSDREGSSLKSGDDDECLESIEVEDDAKISPDENEKCKNSDADENKSNSDDEVNEVINEIHSDMERESKTSKSLENEESDCLAIESEVINESVNETNDDCVVEKENQSLIGGAASDISCTTLNSSDNDNQKKKINDLNFDPISDSEEDKKKSHDQRNRSSSSPRKDKLPNGKNEATSTHKGNKDKDNKTKVKEKETDKESVPWKKLSKNSKDRNYRYGKGKEKPGEENDRKEKKQKRKEIELYDVRKVLEDRPRRKKDKFGRDLSKSSHSDSGSKDRNRRKKRKRSRSKPRRRSISPVKARNRKRSRSRYRSESKTRHRSKSKHRSRSRYRSRSRHRSRSLKHLSKYDKNQAVTKERYRSPVLYDERELSPLVSKRRVKKSKEKTSIYSKIEKDYERKILKNDKIAAKRKPKKSKDYQYSSLSPRSLSPAMPIWQSPRDCLSPWSHTDISRTPSPAYTRHGTGDMDYSSNRDQDFAEFSDNIALNNLTVIVKNDNTKKSKLSKRHTARQVAAPPVKEVFASGDNIMVSVNFNKDTAVEQTSQEPLKRKRQETVPTVSSKKSKNTNTAAVPDITSTVNQKMTTKKGKNPKWQNRKKISRTIEVVNAKPVAIIDLNTSPFREIEMSPKSVIVLTDSDEDKKVAKSETKKDSSPEKCKENVVVEQKPVEKNENSTQTISTIMIGGPKTPPEPVNTISKPDNISNNSCEFNSQDEDQSHDVRGRGPNTPPEPPRSVDTVASETAYDPFEPTKSNSPSPPPRIDIFEDEDDDDNGNNDDDDDDDDDDNNCNNTSAQPPEENKTIDNQSSMSPQIVSKTITPPFLESQNSTQIDKSPEKLATNVTMNQSLYTSPIAAKTPSPVQPTPTAANTNEIIDLDDNDDSQTTAFDNGADSPYSPGEGFVDEMKGSSPDDSPVPQTKNVSTLQYQNKNESRSKLNSLLSILPRSKPPNAFDSIVKLNNFKSLKLSSKSKHPKHNTSNDDSVDDLPGSAVELESKNKFLEKLNRQERVIDEVKLVLKPHYNKKHITKEQYKDIMRKAVPKICHNKSGEINPMKIQSLIEAYVIKYRHSHRKQVQRIPNK